MRDGRENRDSREHKEHREHREYRDSRGERGEDGGRGEGSLGRRGSRTKYRPEFPADFHFDYKDPVTLGRFTMEAGKIIPSRISKLSNNQQRRVAAAVRKARSLGLLPLGTFAYDNFDRPEPISPRPFEID